MAECRYVSRRSIDGALQFRHPLVRKHCFLERAGHAIRPRGRELPTDGKEVPLNALQQLVLETGLEPVVEPSEVVNQVAALLRVRPETPVFVRADRNVDYGAVVRGMTWLQQAGAGKIGLATDPTEP